jgi:uncharacterized Zn-binding protein involved in type VI secretion
MCGEFAMVTRTYLIRGDKANNGATICGGSDSYFWHNVPVAREGDAVYCPVCKRAGTIVCVGPRVPCTDMGKEVALSGDICACGCQPAPVFYASRPFTMTMDAADPREHYGDPIYAGMPWLELMAAAPLLSKQMLAGNGEGHFYYAHVVADSPRRWMSLAERLVSEGLK